MFIIISIRYFPVTTGVSLILSYYTVHRLPISLTLPRLLKLEFWIHNLENTAFAGNYWTWPNIFSLLRYRFYPFCSRSKFEDLFLSVLSVRGRAPVRLFYFKNLYICVCVLVLFSKNCHIYFSSENCVMTWAMTKTMFYFVAYLPFMV